MFGYQMSEISRRYFDYAVKVTTSLASNDVPFPDVIIGSLRAPSSSVRRKVVDVLNHGNVSDFLFDNISTDDYIVDAFVKYLARHGKIYENIGTMTDCRWLDSSYALRYLPTSPWRSMASL